MKILLALDGSEGSAAALDSFLARPWPDGSEVEVVSVAHPWPTIHDPFLLGVALHQQTLEDERKRAAREVATAAERIAREAPRLAVTTATFEGPPKDVLLAEAERFGADLVVVGSHGRGAAGRLVLGSVSHALALHAPCSVEIVRGRKETEPEP